MYAVNGFLVKIYSPHVFKCIQYALILGLQIKSKILIVLLLMCLFVCLLVG